ncbi:MAG: DUF1254 domain-containing protein [Rhizobacter sp.]|nr:DUF1254 domain-containing protein [Rhizobacter sp.]
MTASQASPRQALARSIGLTAFIYGYPLVESLRTCRLQTTPGTSGHGAGAIDALHHVRQPSTDRDRDVVTPANDLLYSIGWIFLGDGPRLLTIPSATKHANRYFVLALYDAYTENFANLGPRNSVPEGETVVLVREGDEVPAALRGKRVVTCPTSLVWHIGRVLVGDEPDWPAARALQADIRIEAAPGTPTGRRPKAVDQWQGEPVDAMAEVFEQGRPVEEVAARFFANLCAGLADAPGRSEDRGLVQWFRQAGLLAGTGFSLDALEPPVKAGLLEGFAEGVQLVGQAARSRRAKPWVLASRAGRYGDDYLVRALTAYIGLGALATDEALYGAGHFDVHGRQLNGAHRYVLRFPAGELPPALAFWSVTMYDADRFLYANDFHRHAIGDRTPGLRHDADGGLTLDVSHTPPPSGSTANWLPAPAGNFYLILRLYHPRDDVRAWKTPALVPVQEVSA